MPSRERSHGAWLSMPYRPGRLVVEREEVVRRRRLVTDLRRRCGVLGLVGPPRRRGDLGPGGELVGLGLLQGRLGTRFEGHAPGGLPSDLGHRAGRRLAPVRDDVVVLLERHVVVAEHRATGRGELVVGQIATFDDPEGLEIV